MAALLCEPRVRHVAEPHQIATLEAHGANQRRITRGHRLRAVEELLYNIDADHAAAVRRSCETARIGANGAAEIECEARTIGVASLEGRDGFGQQPRHREEWRRAPMLDGLAGVLLVRRARELMSIVALIEMSLCVSVRR